MLDFCKELKMIKKLSSKTKVFHFVDLFKKMFGQSMVMLKIDVCKIFEMLAERLRKNMRQECRQTIPIMLKELKIKNRQLKEQIFKTVEKMFLCINLDDILEDIKDNLKGKNVEKQSHILDIVLMMLKKSNLVDNQSDAIRVCTIVKP